MGNLVKLISVVTLAWTGLNPWFFFLWRIKLQTCCRCSSILQRELRRQIFLWEYDFKMFFLYNLRKHTLEGGCYVTCSCLFCCAWICLFILGVFICFVSVMLGRFIPYLISISLIFCYCLCKALTQQLTLEIKFKSLGSLSDSPILSLFSARWMAVAQSRSSSPLENS